jgi:hypothetical protein
MEILAKVYDSFDASFTANSSLTWEQLLQDGGPLHDFKTRLLYEYKYQNQTFQARLWSHTQTVGDANQKPISKRIVNIALQHHEQIHIPKQYRIGRNKFLIPGSDDLTFFSTLRTRTRATHDRYQLFGEWCPDGSAYSVKIHLLARSLHVPNVLVTFIQEHSTIRLRQ